MLNIAIFVSGNGTNCENIIRHFTNNATARVALVLSNKEEAYALTRARRMNIPASAICKADFYNRDFMTDILKKYEIDFIVLAGFLLMVPDFLIDAYDHRMINIHPALLPRHGGKGMYGMNVHKAVKECGDTETGFTVHWVSIVCDGGTIIAQRSTPVDKNDTPEDIASKEHELEMRFFPLIIEETIKDIEAHRR